MLLHGVDLVDLLPGSLLRGMDGFEDENVGAEVGIWRACAWVCAAPIAAIDRRRRPDRRDCLVKRLTTAIRSKAFQNL